MNGPWTDIRVDGDSGKDGAELVVYEYAVVNEEAWTSFVLSCPKEEQERFASVAERMEKSLGF